MYSTSVCLDVLAGSLKMSDSLTGKLSSMVRSVAHNDSTSYRSSQNTPTSWDQQSSRDRHQPTRQDDRDFSQRDSRATSNRDSKGSQRERIERLGLVHHQQSQPPPPPPQQQQQHPPPPSPPTQSRTLQQHVRNGSGTTSSGDYAEAQNGNGRRHDYDVHAMETEISSPRASSTKNPIPAPIVTVRSEFPTLNRSRQQQSLTCLVTIEVPEGKWHPNLQDLHHAPVMRSGSQEDAYSMIQSPVRPTHSHEVTDEELAALEETTEELKTRVDNWHGLEFERQADPGGGLGASANSKLDSASCVFTAPFVLAKISGHGRNLSAICSTKCSYA